MIYRHILVSTVQLQTTLLGKEVIMNIPSAGSMSGGPAPIGHDLSSHGHINLLCLDSFPRQGFLCSPDYPGNSSAVQVDLELRDPPASQMLGVKVWATTARHHFFFLLRNVCMCEGTDTTAHSWRSVFSFLHVNPRDQSQVVRHSNFCID